MKHVCATTVAMEKQYYIFILSVCLYPSLSSMRSAWKILSSVACPALQYFFTLFQKWYNFQKNSYWI